MRFGMQRLIWFALTLKCSAALAMMVVSLVWQGQPPLWLFLSLGIPIFFSMGLLFGNINAMAMEPLGRMAGLGASLISSLSSLLAVVLSVSVGRFYDFSVTPLAAGYVIFTSLAVVLMWRVRRLLQEKHHGTQETTPS
ncbi:MAG: Bcr/CflA family drug resistance efflux transporter, partial [Pseudomonadota bacterium]|nr:Bcr/CflA family drug resistance efflux transporter [Pseudomonadota bacterium]